MLVEEILTECSRVADGLLQQTKKHIWEFKLVGIFMMCNNNSQGCEAIECQCPKPAFPKTRRETKQYFQSKLNIDHSLHHIRAMHRAITSRQGPCTDRSGGRCSNLPSR
jgi:hypothetical protein